ncbi:MAG: nucleotide pyrophosphatase [Candidatus Schekmanbacteria bacterium]|nr:MAG: nucleotide pyrophosphatase [Candidatus Schekmanbacteria bacterium]
MNNLQITKSLRYKSSSVFFKKYIPFAILLIFFSYDADAYIGPGAGFAFISSFFVLFVTFLLAFLSILVWPIRYIIRTFIKKRSGEKTDVERVVVLGLDGLDPALVTKYMNEGKLPNFSKLKEEGSFSPLRTTYPAMSPVAWSSFITGVDPSRHNIFDFLKRDVRTYLPDISSVHIGNTKKTLNIGKYKIPIGKPEITLLRKSQPFWKILGDNHIFSAVLRVPITFPPEKFYGVSLSGMCVPDLKGTQGSFTYYTTDKNSVGKHTGGVRVLVERKNNIIESHIKGPENSLLKNGGEMTIPFKIEILNDSEAILKLPDEEIKLKKGEYTDWKVIVFKAGLGIKVQGICRFLLRSVSPEFELYITPINIDPDTPAMPISHPLYYSVYLSKMQGRYATLGLAEDTWALNERVIDEEAFLGQAYKYYEERREMFFNMLDKIKKGMVACVFDTSDRIQHMFFRYIDDRHPANKDKDTVKHKNSIEDMYKKMDELVGETMQKLGEKDVLMVISDHGFKSFRRCVNLNTWFHQNGYMHFKDGGTGGEWFQGVDWSKTRAYTFGLGGIYINLKGREGQGIVEPGEEYENLKKELCEKLNNFQDEEWGETAICRLYDNKELFSGPYAGNGPDLFVGFNVGYRTSWEAAVGKCTDKVIEDNTKSWSGDHCIDPRLAPGILFCSRKIDADSPSIMDIGPTVLKLYGLDIPKYMQGKPLINNV